MLFLGNVSANITIKYVLGMICCCLCSTDVRLVEVISSYGYYFCIMPILDPESTE